MMHDSKTIHVTPGSELDRLLMEADEASIELEKSGVRYRVVRVSYEPTRERYAPDSPTPDAILNLIGIGASEELTDIARHEQEYLADAIDPAHRQ